MYDLILFFIAQFTDMKYFTIQVREHSFFLGVGSAGGMEGRGGGGKKDLPVKKGWVTFFLKVKSGGS